MSQKGVLTLDNLAPYLRSKCLDHGEWAQGEKILPRSVTPSDIDMVFDNVGSLLFCELSRYNTKWEELKFGQRSLYESLVYGNKNCSVLCKHSVDKGQIYSRTNINSFHPMIFCGGRILYCNLVSGNERWQKFVLGWYSDPGGIWDFLAKQHANEGADNGTNRMLRVRTTKGNQTDKEGDNISLQQLRREKSKAYP